jgi:hypothetical protein
MCDSMSKNGDPKPLGMSESSKDMSLSPAGQPYRPSQVESTTAASNPWPMSDATLDEVAKDG